MRGVADRPPLTNRTPEILGEKRSACVAAGWCGVTLPGVRGVPFEFYASSQCRLLGLLPVLEGPTDIDEPKHRDGWAIEHPCRPTADANAEVPF